MLHYNPQHVSSSTLLIFRRTNCIITASGIVTLCKRPVESGPQSALNRHTVWLFTEGDDTRGCGDTILFFGPCIFNNEDKNKPTKCTN